jgi:hypothetical protein
MDAFLGAGTETAGSGLNRDRQVIAERHGAQVIGAGPGRGLLARVGFPAAQTPAATPVRDRHRL